MRTGTLTKQNMECPTFRFSVICDFGKLVLLLVFSGTSLSGIAQSRMDEIYDFELKDQTIAEGLWELSQQAKIGITFSNNDFDEKRYTLSFQHKRLEDILLKLLAFSNTTYTYSGNEIVVYRKPPVKFTISGYVEDEYSGERLIGASVFDITSQQGTNTNEYGFFSLTLTTKDPVLQISYLGFQTFKQEITSTASQQLHIQLRANLTLEEIVVSSGVSEKDILQFDQVDAFTNTDNLDNLPSLGGEVDIIRAIQLLPGVQSGTDGFGGLHVRGGNADQNLVLLDGVPIFNPYHTLGLFSIFDHKIVRKVKYLRGQFPARYGGRISSVIDVRTREGNNKTYHAHGSIGLIASKFGVEGPIKKEKGAFFISARRSHIEPFLKKYSEKKRADENDTGGFNYHFGEVIGKLNYTLGEKDKLFLSYYRGNDNYKNERKGVGLSGEESRFVSWGNTLGVVRWNHQFGNKLFANATGTYSLFKFNSDEIENLFFENTDLDGNPIDTLNYFQQSGYRSKVENISAKIDFDYVPKSKHYLRFGAAVSQLNFTPGAVEFDNSDIVAEEDVIPDSLFNSNSIRATEISTYAEEEWKIGDRILINLGYYASLFAVEDTSYLQFNPRLNASFQVHPTVRLQVSANKMSQNLHLLTTSGAGFPNDLWVPSTGRVKPQTAWVIDARMVWAPNTTISLSASAYYKKMNNLIDYKEGVNFLVNAETIDANNWEDKISVGMGRSKGIELLLNIKKDKFTSWVSYSYSKTDRIYPSINNGETYPFRFDLPHVFNVVLSYAFSENWTVASTWSFQNGSKISLPRNEWQYITQDGTPDFNYLNFGKKNNFELPKTHRLDFSVRYQHEKKWGKWSMGLGIYNVYNRKNIFFVRPNFNPESGSRGYTSTSLIPFLPYFNLSIEL